MVLEQIRITSHPVESFWVEPFAHNRFCLAKGDFNPQLYAVSLLDGAPHAQIKNPIIAHKRAVAIRADQSGRALKIPKPQTRISPKIVFAYLVKIAHHIHIEAQKGMHEGMKRCGL